MVRRKELMSDMNSKNAIQDMKKKISKKGDTYLEPLLKNFHHPHQHILNNSSNLFINSLHEFFKGSITMLKIL